MSLSEATEANQMNPQDLTPHHKNSSWLFIFPEVNNQIVRTYRVYAITHPAIQACRSAHITNQTYLAYT